MAGEDEPHRKRKAHTKSRQGCGKHSSVDALGVKSAGSRLGAERQLQASAHQVRRVEADMSEVVACTYESQGPDLEFAGVGSFRLDISQPATPPETPPRSVEELIDSLRDAPLQLHVDDPWQQNDTVFISEPHLALLRKFYYRTSGSIGTTDSHETYRDVMTREAANHSFVLHALLKFVLMHDRYLYHPLGTKPSAAEAFHGYHATALFGKKLAGPIEEEAKDAMWGAAAILGASTFAGIDATCAQEAWPLRPSELSDLAWLKMSEGKREIWRLVDPLREGSAYRTVLRAEHNRKEDGHRRALDPELNKLFPYVTRLFNLDTPRSDSEPKDPYRTMASIVERLVPLECTHSTVMWFLSFIGHMDQEYRELLEEKDPAAMLLLSWWYAKLIPYDAWWLRRRALLECQAICIYLDGELSPDHDIRKLLEFPRRVCGVGSGPSSKSRVVDTPSATFPWPRNF